PVSRYGNGVRLFDEKCGLDRANASLGIGVNPAPASRAAVAFSAFRLSMIGLALIQLHRHEDGSVGVRRYDSTGRGAKSITWEVIAGTDLPNRGAHNESPVGLFRAPDVLDTPCPPSEDLSGHESFRDNPPASRPAP